jgi:3-carboxy-cis,cis-muconate cycloisomerase
MASLLEPGSHRAPGLDDGALVRAMLRVEVAWMHALAQAGAATPAQAAAVADAADGLDPHLSPAAVEAAGNPVLPRWSPHSGRRWPTRRRPAWCIAG